MDDNTSLDKTESRKALVQAAAKLFREKGYERTTVRDLARAVGMQSGSLFYHFSSKGEILFEVMRQGIESVTENVRNELANIDSPREKLVAVTRSHLDTLLCNSEASLASLLYEWRSLPEDQKNKIVSSRDEYETLCREILDEAKAENLVQGDTKLLARLWLGSINWTTQWFNDSGKLSIQELAEQIVDLMLLKRPSS